MQTRGRALRCIRIRVIRPGYAIVRFLTRGTTSTNMPMGWSGDLFPSGMIRPGDVVSINGTEFALLGDNSSVNDTYANIQLDNPTSSQPYFIPKGNNSPPQILALPLNDSGQQIYPKYDSIGQDIASNGNVLKRPYWTNAAPYKILRQPTLTSDEPYQLPEGTAIDLRASGVGADNYFYVPNVHDNDQNILVLFTPEGRVARVTYSMGPPDSL